MNMHDYPSYDAVGLAGCVAAGEVTAMEVLEAAISIIEALNPAINAVIFRNDASARAAASRPPVGPLAGVPFLLKDVYLYSFDLPTTWGSRYFKGSLPRADSLMVERWRKSGLVILGKTNAPEFATEFVTEPAAYGRTLNPWDARKTVGGSSGGAAAAVASGMVPMAHATDCGGSIRIPAACCGVYGFKPSSGLNPCGPWFKELAHGLNSDHVLTRSVRDSAASLDVTAGGEYFSRLGKSPRALCCLVTVETAEGTRAGNSQVAAVTYVAELLHHLGHLVYWADRSPFIRIGDWFDLLWIDDIPKILSDEAHRTGISAATDDLEAMTWAALARRHGQGEDALKDALCLKDETAKAHLALLAEYDILLTPSLATDPAPVDTLAFRNFGDFDTWAQAGYSFAPFSILANIAGQPSASLPIPLACSDIPVGVQVTGKPGCDLQVLQLSRQIEDVVKWQNALRPLWSRLFRSVQQ